jgi:hypothetical protein
MKVLFAVSSESISEAIIKKYQKEYKEILSYKNVYYFNAILKEIQKDKTYDRIVISEDLEPFSNNNYDAIDKFIFEKLDNISDEAQDIDGNETSIILICTDRHTKGSSFLVKLFSIGIYNALLGSERSIDNVCKLINKPRVKKEAKMNYKIDAEDANYNNKDEKEVSELEIQNILTHFKKLGKNTNKYAESFNSISTQYTDDQLKIIINCLPINVKAVLEEDCQKYQELMSVNGMVQKVNRESIKTKESQNQTGIKIDIIENKMNQAKMSGPIVIPSSVRTSKSKGPTAVRPMGNDIEIPTGTNETTKVKKVVKKETPAIASQEKVAKTVQKQVSKETGLKKQPVQTQTTSDQMKKVKKVAETNEGALRKSGAVQKKVVATSDLKPKATVQQVKKENVAEPLKKKKPVMPFENEVKKIKPEIEDDDEELILPGMNNDFEDDDLILPQVDDFEDDTLPGVEDEEENTLPGLDDDFEDETLPGVEDEEEENTLPGLDDDFEDETLPGVEDEDEEENTLPGLDDDFEDETLPGVEDEDEEENTLPGLDDDFEDDTLPGLDDDFEDDTLPGLDDDEYTDEVALPGLDELDDLDDLDSPSPKPDMNDDLLPGIEGNENADEDLLSGIDDFSQEINESSNEIESIKPQVDYSMSSLNSLLTKDKKIVTFLGTTKNGTSFLVNNLAALFASVGINTAILDMTKNRNSYYIYTNNEEELRKIAYNSISKLQKGFAEGIKVDKNLTVYTALPNDGKDYSDAEPILSTLVQNHSLVLIDCDFDTDPSYFASCQEIYLVQSMDILTIQPLTAFLRDLKAKGVLESEKVRVVINKEIKVKSLTTKAIIGGMSFYNDPSMSFMTELFNKDMVKACSIPFEDNVYSKYLDAMVNCKVSLNGYSKQFINQLRNLGNMVYPLVSKPTYGNGKTTVQQNYGKNSFSNNMNNTLNQMKKKF